MSLLAALDAIEMERKVNPSKFRVVTAAQERWIRMGSPLEPLQMMIWRGGNQVGKSQGQAMKILSYLRRTGPWSTRPKKPAKILLISTSKEQMIPLMEKLAELLPVNECKFGFEPGFGFRGKPPRVLFTGGPAKGSILTFATYAQGSTRIAGDTVDVVILDEPPPESMWSEIALRVMRKGGQVWASFTPTPESPPVDYLIDQVKSGQITELQTSLNERNLTPTDPRIPPFLRQEQIQEILSMVLPIERNMREHGDPTPQIGRAHV